MNLITKITGDGSHTLFVPELNEHYHSIHGAINESVHVYIEAGLKHIHTSDISVFEIGFGTGLNAYLTLLFAMENKCKINYTAIELFPLDMNIVTGLNYSSCLKKENVSFLQLHKAQWNKKVIINDYFTMYKIKADLTEYKFFEKASLIYFDAFGPEKQPELWKECILKKVTDILNPDGIFVTYSAKGIIKRILKSLSLKVETIPGPKGKKEMIRAIKIV